MENTHLYSEMGNYIEEGKVKILKGVFEYLRETKIFWEEIHCMKKVNERNEERMKG